MRAIKLGRTLAATAICAAVAIGSNVLPTESSEAASKSVVPVHLSAPRAKLLWQMQFSGRSGNKPSSSVFNYDLGGGGWGNAEHQAYTDYNALLTGTGKLKISVNRVQYDLEDLYPDCPIDSVGNACEFESARLNTKGKLNFKYGRLVARIKNPSGYGTWPAFWLLGSDIENNAWPNCGEIDIMEGKGSEPFTTFGTAHGPGYSGGDGIVNARALSQPLSAGYHTYQVDWLPNSIKWYVDGKLYHTVTPSIVGDHPWVFNKSMFMILNVAVGGWFAGEVDPDLESAEMRVDYIRYYSLNGVGTLTGTTAAKNAGKP